MSEEQETEERAHTKIVLGAFLYSSVLYLVVQQTLNVFVWYRRVSLNTFTVGEAYFYAPAISVVGIGIAYLSARRFYRSRGAHYMLYALSWGLLLAPQMIPPFVHGLNIIYTTWVFIMATSATLAVMFQDLALPTSYGRDRDALKFLFEELKFYMDRLTFAWVALGAITGVAMTILWQGPTHAFEMRYDERVLWAVYIVFCFFTVSLIALLFAGFPIYRHLIGVRRAYVGFISDSPGTELQTNGSGNERTLTNGSTRTRRRRRRDS